MKKFLTFFAVLTLTVAVLCAEEKVLFDSSVKANLDGFDYISNFEITSDSGYFQGRGKLKILEPTERGIRFLANGVPGDVSTNYKVLVAYPSFLNEDGAGAGFIYNTAGVKSIKIEGTTNRPYDEVYLLYKTSPTGPTQKVLFPQDFNQIKSMEDFELVWENPNYEPDVNKRNIKATPVLGSESNGLYLVGFQVKTNAATGGNAFSPYSVLYLRKVVVVYDKLFTDEQVEANKAMREDFGISPNENITKKVKAEVSQKNRLRETEKSLMATE